MDATFAHIQFLRDRSYFTLHILQGGQNDIKRFVYCCTEKLYKCSLAIEKIYPFLNDLNDVEFGVGLILRSLLMDCIQIQYLRSLIGSGEDQENVKKIIKDKALMFIVDGTAHIIKDFFDFGEFTIEEKINISKRIADNFPMAFEIGTNGKPKLRNAYKFDLRTLYKESAPSNPVVINTIYNLYAYYSKYDHVSHWTSFLGNSSVKERANKIKSVIAMIFLSYRDLLALGSFVDDELRLLVAPTIAEIDMHGEEHAATF